MAGKTKLQSVYAWAGAALIGFLIAASCLFFYKDYVQRVALPEMLTVLFVISSLCSYFYLRTLEMARYVFPVRQLIASMKDTPEGHLPQVPTIRNSVLLSLHKAYMRLVHEMHHLAFFDQLTGLANRRNFQRTLRGQLEACKKEQKKLALMFIDLDNFKRVNDQFGHATGDRLLFKFSQRLRECIRPSDFAASLQDSSLARLAGDEFALVLTDESSTQCIEDVAEEILTVLADGFEVDGIHHNVQASIGIAMYPQHGVETEDLLSHADAAMYEAKDAGRNRYKFFSPQIAERLQKQRRIEMLLDKTIASCDFDVKLEPVFCSGGFKLCSFDIQVLIPSLADEQIGIEEAVNIAETAGIIKQFDRNVIERAAFTLHRLHEHGFSGSISVDFSAHSLHCENDILEIISVISNYAIQPGDIELKIRHPKARAVCRERKRMLDRLAEHGFKLSINVLNDGQVALTEISQIPLNSLRIDPRWIWDIDHGSEAKLPMADFVINMSNIYGIATMADGVSTQTEFEFLGARGCQVMKGEFFGTPVNLPGAVALLEKHADAEIVENTA